MTRMHSWQGALALAGVLALSASCTGQNPGGMGTITGQVTRSPTCPGPQRPGQDCTAPAAGATIRTLGRPMASTRTDPDGRYSFTFIALGPVTLVVDAEEAGAMSCEQPTVTPHAGQTVTQDIACDTGIR
jgi:hypothetical protein